MASNGNLPDSVLAPILGGQLRKDAAAAWNAMCYEAGHRGLSIPTPDGSESSYRTFAQQIELRKYWCNQGNCGNAAVPGTSNHGLGIAVDCTHNDPARHRATVDVIGAKFGWGSAGSDAPWEEWHMRWQPVWSGPDPGPYGAPVLIDIPDDPQMITAVAR